MIQQPKRKRTYMEAVDSISPEASTNISEAMEVTFEEINKTDPKIPSWVFVVTDGEANVGRYTRSDLLGNMTKTFVKSRPNTSFVMLGLGTQYTPETLASMGTFTHVRDLEVMNATLTLCVLEVLQAEAVSCKFLVPRKNYPPDLIRPALPQAIELIGTQQFDVITSDSEYVYGVMISGLDNSDPYVSEYIGMDCGFEYIDLMGIKHTITTKIVGDNGQPLSQIPIDVVLQYYKSAKGRMLRELIATFKTKTFDTNIASVRSRLDKWDTTPEELSKYGVDEKSSSSIAKKIDEIKADVEVVISQLKRSDAHSDAVMFAMSSAIDATNQRIITNGGMYTNLTPGIQPAVSSPIGLMAVNLTRQTTQVYTPMSPPKPQYLSTVTRSFTSF